MGPTPKEGAYLAPGWGRLTFEAPAPGTYELPVVGPAAGGAILDEEGNALDLDDLLGEKITLLSFIFRTCDDSNGCPLSTMVLHRIGAKMKGSTELGDNLRLLTLSFDPEFDTPAVMKAFGEGFVDPNEPEKQIDWRFLTSESDDHIRPILDSYQQTIVIDPALREGRRTFSHILRVYLIDREKQVRNIYNVSFLHPDILLNDVLTLLADEEQGRQAQKKAQHESANDIAEQ